MTESKHPKPITFTIDGKQCTTSDSHQPAADLLRLAGVDPTLYDLAEIKGHGEYKTFRDDQNVQIKDGDEYVTVRQSAPVA
jgi:hypothetical protein